MTIIHYANPSDVATITLGRVYIDCDSLEQTEIPPGAPWPVDAEVGSCVEVLAVDVVNGTVTISGVT